MSTGLFENEVSHKNLMDFWIFSR